jgi:hypothetical protein
MQRCAAKCPRDVVESTADEGGADLTEDDTSAVVSALIAGLRLEFDALPKVPEGVIVVGMIHRQVVNLHGIVLLEGLDELGDGGMLLTNGDVDAIELLAFVSAIVPAPLVEDSVNGDGSPAGLTFTDDELTLATTNGHHRIERLEAGQHGLVDGTAGENGGGFDRGTAASHRLMGPLQSMGLPRASTTRPKRMGPTGTSTIWPLVYPLRTRPVSAERASNLRFED